MKRRNFIGAMGAAGATLALNASANQEGAFSYDRPVFHDGKLKAPKKGPVRVAFAISNMANVMDLAGPWEVFQDVYLGNRAAFELYTVAATTEPITATGGLKIIPNYSITDAPTPHILTVGAQSGKPELTTWMQEVSHTTDVTMSICTGAFQLGKAGLLDGLKATTHHDFFDAFEKKHPQVELLRGPRFVENGKIATAGGLTSGIDLALRIVAKYHGDEVAGRTARYMEYTGTGWRRS